MQTLTKDHVIILPHAEEYRQGYTISRTELLLTLNEPDLREGLSGERYTAEKTIGARRVYIYYYQTLPLQARPDALYAVIDFIGFSDA
jgi:hypothetical protein